MKLATERQIMLIATNLLINLRQTQQVFLISLGSSQNPSNTSRDSQAVRWNHFQQPASLFQFPKRLKSNTKLSKASNSLTTTNQHRWNTSPAKFLRITEMHPIEVPPALTPQVHFPSLIEPSSEEIFREISDDTNMKISQKQPASSLRPFGFLDRLFALPNQTAIRSQIPLASTAISPKRISGKKFELGKMRFALRHQSGNSIQPFLLHQKKPPTSAVPVNSTKVHIFRPQQLRDSQIRILGSNQSSKIKSHFPHTTSISSPVPRSIPKHEMIFPPKIAFTTQLPIAPNFSTDSINFNTTVAFQKSLNGHVVLSTNYSAEQESNISFSLPTLLFTNLPKFTDSATATSFIRHSDLTESTTTTQFEPIMTSTTAVFIHGTVSGLLESASNSSIILPNETLSVKEVVDKLNFNDSLQSEENFDYNEIDKELRGVSSFFGSENDKKLQKGVGPIPPSTTVLTRTVSATTSMSVAPFLSSSAGASSAPTNIGAPAFLPPNDRVIAQLNNAQNFLAIAESMQLKRRFKGAE